MGVGLNSVKTTLESQTTSYAGLFHAQRSYNWIMEIDFKLK